MATQEKKEQTDFQVKRQYVPASQPDSDYPLIDNDPHFKRVVRYMRGSDYAVGLAAATSLPGFIWANEYISPTFVGRSGRLKILRLNIAVGATLGFIWAYSRSINRFYGARENQREIDMDMREMTDRAKKGLPLYGESRLSEHIQGVAARNSRYSGLMLHIVPMFNFVNHPFHGVDTAKYYQNAERELEAEKSRS